MIQIKKNIFFSGGGRGEGVGGLKYVGFFTKNPNLQKQKILGGGWGKSEWVFFFNKNPNLK